MHLPIKKRKTSASRNAEDVDIDVFGSRTTPTETHSIGSGSSPTETNNGASSSLISSTGNCYEVFLSFRGLDTRKGFTDHLYRGLLGARIDVFRDDDELPQGENIRLELLAAITNSKILIPILSVNYGASSWCLDELVQIMECKKNNGQIVLPIFYKVKPADVRHQIGSFGEAFHERERRLLERNFNPMILKKWKQALHEVCTLKGYEADGCEGKLVKSVVRKVLSELKKKFELVIPENLIGIDGQVEKVMKFVDDNSNATLFIGIHGMGGIGKTTLAKAIYNKLSDQFKYHSFIADIRESCKRNGLTYLQNQLISNILNRKNQASNKDEGIKLISSKFKHKKVLILLDDVDDDDQLKALVGNQDWFSPGSRIFITTRKINVLDNKRVNFIYEHEVMDKNHSMVLFSRHAFRRNSPPSEFEDLARDAITTTGGLPLSLEVLGSLLCGKQQPFWRDTIAKSKKVPPKKVQERLRISYEDLDYRQKQIFLDIACSFIGEDREIISYMWDACEFFPGEGIEVLRFMSLIKIGDDNKFIMHDQLRDLGREIVCEENQGEPQCRSRLWDSKEVLKVLSENKGTNKIEGIHLSEGNSESSVEIARRDDNIYTTIQFKNLTSLRFLLLEGARMKELKSLGLQNCPVNLEVNNFHVKELPVLELQGGELNVKWEGESFFMMAEKLKYLNLTYFSVEEDMDFLLAFKKLEVLILKEGTSIGRLDLPKFGRLKKLEVGDCVDLSKIEGLDRLEDLERLDIQYCMSIGRLDLPKSGRLKELEVGDCENLAKIEGLDRLEYLERLDIQCCISIGRLDLPKFGRLKELKVGDCFNLAKIEGLDRLEYLERLDIESSILIGRLDLPKSGRLKALKVRAYINLAEIEGLDRLEYLERHYCTSIGRLDLPKFGRLKELKVRDCINLAEIEGLDSLERLDIK